MTLFQELSEYRVKWVERMFVVAARVVGPDKEMHMELTKLATLTFDKNVGVVDQVLRLTSGAGLVAAGWYLGLPLWACISMTVLGSMWTATGILSKCSIYYVFGYSTCPIADNASLSRRPT